MALVLLVFVTILIGSCMQRVSGIGVGILGGPVLSLAMGPVEGIMVVNAIAAVNGLMSTINQRSDIDWRKFGVIGSTMVLGAVPGAWLIHVISPAVLQVIVGALILLALSVTTVGKRFIPAVSGRVPAMSAGVVGGLSNTLAGVAGPVLTVYAQASRWEQRTFAATLQPLFVVAGTLSFSIKWFSGAGDIGAEPRGIWPAALVAILLGIAVGIRISRRVPRTVAHRVALALAAVGALTVLVRGTAAIIC
ncbi:sulfite exporter TauE/SafE family protein [uncultured Corynebacterium sp.]|uniref:sulfite exporter TauE/SafE family protein n=1 Tax=uncultured Corynebacterium sp. TaxID=159447 RepID=UPI0025F97918|nr:sulfite exporter TauE/SafE family protein [uncultured Corynebacterium sp.]